MYAWAMKIAKHCILVFVNGTTLIWFKKLCSNYDVVVFFLIQDNMHKHGDVKLKPRFVTCLETLGNIPMQSEPH